MSRVFAYARVSTVEQLTENQRGEIAAAGYAVEPRRFVEEQVSGSVPATQRPGFVKLLDKLERGDTLVVTKLDRLGRDSIDVQQTVERFASEGIRLVVLQLRRDVKRNVQVEAVGLDLGEVGDVREPLLILERLETVEDR